MIFNRITRANVCKILWLLSVTENLYSKYKYGRKKRYTAAQQRKKLGTKLLTQLRKGGWKLAKSTSKRDKNKAPEVTQYFKESSQVSELPTVCSSVTSIQFRTKHLLYFMDFTQLNSKDAPYS